MPRKWFSTFDLAWTVVERIEKQAQEYYSITGNMRAYDLSIALTDALDALQDLCEVEELKYWENNAEK